MTKKSKLFLHYGPGGNAKVERAWLGTSATDVDFWDQPQLNEDKISYTNLLDGCRKKLNSMYEHNGTPITVLGHSFGCNLALDLVVKEREKIKSLFLFSPISNLRGAFYQLGKKLVTDINTPAVLRSMLEDALKKYENDQDKRSESFWGIVGVASQAPTFPRLFWGKTKAFEKYTLLTAKAGPLNLQMWQGIINDYLDFTFIITDHEKIKIKIFIGALDPYIDLASELAYWKKKLPHATVQTLSGCGHYTHLESDAFSTIL